MKTSDKKLISRGVDGELSFDERVKLDVLLKTETDASTTANAMEKIGDHLRAESARVQVPDAAVAWRDIQRAIRLEEDAVFVESTHGFGRLGWAGVFAGIMILGLLGLWARMIINRPSEQLVADHVSPVSRVEWVKAEIPGATTMIYTDTETDLTVIWMDVAQSAEPRDS